MSRFARIGEEVFARQSELTAEEFRLYVIIFFHTFFDTGICKKNLRQLSRIYGLSYTHTTERYKILLMDFSKLSSEEKTKRLQIMKSPWCENTKKGVRPLVGLKVPKTGTFEGEMFRKPEHTYSENRNIDVPKTGTFEGEMFRKPEHTYKEYIEPLETEIFSTAATAEKNVAAAVETNSHKSKFSIEECLRWAQICVQRGEPITNPHGLATNAYQTGGYDVFIDATLYPETAALEESEPELVLDEQFEALNFLIDAAASGHEILEFEKNYAPEIWNWLMGELR